MRIRLIVPFVLIAVAGLLPAQEKPAPKPTEVQQLRQQVLALRQQHEDDLITIKVMQGQIQTLYGELRTAKLDPIAKEQAALNSEIAAKTEAKPDAKPSAKKEP